MTTLLEITREWPNLPPCPDIPTMGIAQKTAQQRQRQGMTTKVDRGLLQVLRRPTYPGLAEQNSSRY